MLTGTQRALALELINIGAVRFGAFRLKLHERNPAAPLSPIYIDLRLIRSFPKAMEVAVDAYTELTRGLKFDYFADVPTAATPMVAVLSYKTGKAMITPRADRKGHGTGVAIDGSFEPGHIAVVVDDLITRAESKLEAIAILESNGVNVEAVLVLIDREQGGIAELAKRGYACRSALSLSELLAFYKSEGAISPDDYKRTIDYITASA